MRLEGYGHSSSLRWVLVALAAIGTWLAFSSNNNRRPIVSGWSGDGPPAAAAPKNEPPAPLAGIFGKQNSATGNGLAADPHDADMPWGNPTDNPAAVMTQGYGVGTHAPANVWGAIDIALDGNGDGNADPTASNGAPVYATHSGVVKVTPNSVPAGNHIWVHGERYKTGYAHLKAFAVETGASVKRGDLIGYIGSTGQSSGPHLDYQVWKDGVNQNPLDYGALP